jgi:sugar lactone lactonase YvrE
VVDAGGGAVDAALDGAPVLISLELLAGDIGGAGDVDGTGAAAHFYGPQGVAVDAAGNVYVADTTNNTIRKVTPTGVVTTLAGTPDDFGLADGTGAAALFNTPTGVAVDSAGNVYVTDSGSAIRKVTPAGVVTTLAGSRMSGSTDGTGADARFNVPRGVAVDGDGNVYVADFFNETLRKVTPAGVVTTLAGSPGQSGSADGTGADARFDGPAGVAVGGDGNVYVAESVNATLRKVTPAGVVTTVPGSAGHFRNPFGVAVDSTGNIYVADTFNHSLGRITPAGVVTTLAGIPGMAGTEDGTGADARFNLPFNLAIDGAGMLYVADASNTAIRKVTPAGVVTTLAGSPSRFGSADGSGADARFERPDGVAADGDGNIYVADSFNATIRKITPAGVVTTLAGTAHRFGSADGTGADARFGSPFGVAVDGAGNVYVADEGNDTLRKVTPAGVVTTLAGTAGMSGSADGTGAGARFHGPRSVAVDGAGNVYVADTGNNTIRKITASGVVTTLAGTPGIQGLPVDGTGAAARFNEVLGVAVDGAGNVYVADNTTVRKITPAGVVTTLTDSATRFSLATGVALDRAGNVYVADNVDSTIHKVTPTGTTTTIAGMPFVSGILLGAAPRFAFPESLIVVGDSLMISDLNAILVLRHGAQ